MKQENIPGMFLTIVNKDSVLFSNGIGYSDLDKQKRVNNQTIFRMGSITKTFTALAIMKLVEKGKISLNDKLKNIIPEIEFQNDWENTHPVRVIHLLEHTSGFDDEHFADKNIKGLDSNIPLADVLKITNSLTCKWKPGTCYAYSNPGYTLAGYIIEKFSNKSYEEFIHEQILKPLGMKNSSMDNIFKNLSAFSKGYLKNGSITPMTHSYHRPAGEFNSCSSDMALFLKTLLNTGQNTSIKIVSDESIYKMEVPSSSLSARTGLWTGYGLGMILLLLE